MANRARRRACHRDARLSRRYVFARDDVRNGVGSRSSDRRDGARRSAFAHFAGRGRALGFRGHGDGLRRALRLRFGRAVGEARRCGLARGRRSRCVAARMRRSDSRRGHAPRGEFHAGTGRTGRLRTHLFRVVRGVARAPERSERARGNGRSLARVRARVRLRRAVPVARRPLAARSRGAHLYADGRHRGGGDHLAPRTARRQAQLGLPLLLAARRDLHALRADVRRVHRGRDRLARMALACRGRQRVRFADRLQFARSAAPAGIGITVARGVRRFATRARRERRARAVPARRLR